MLKIHIVTLFPEFFKSPLETGILGRAVRNNLLNIHFVNPRDFTADLHKTVDTPPFGGGDGMVMQYTPLKKAIQSLPSSARICFLTPQGQQWNYQLARTWAQEGHSPALKGHSPELKNAKKEWTFICGRYGGVDQRLINEMADEEISIGDYVLTGGEPALLVLLDSLCRFVKGALGNEHSSNRESFENQKLLECPQWTKPRDIAGHQIPKVLLTGHHKNIKQFRYFASVVLTAQKRPDLLAKSPAQKDLKAAQSFIYSTLSHEEQAALGLIKKKPL